MFPMYAYDHVRMEMEAVRRRAEHLSRHRPPTTRRSMRTRTPRRNRTGRP
jgi:hypothetical protein